MAKTIRVLARTGVVGLALATATPALASGAGSIIAVEENGRVVYVNNETAGPTSERKQPRRAANLVYWSVTEQRWKPVPSPTPSMMKAARSAAEEVASFVETRPASAQAPPVANPNYRDLARGRVVTSAEVERAIDDAAQRHNVDPNLVRAVIKVESNFNPRAVSRAGAMGLMQLMPATARSLNVTNPFDPQENVDAGVRHLKSLLEDFGGDVHLSLAAYNAGAGAVRRRGYTVPNFAETRKYVRDITSLYAGGSPLTSIRSVIRSAPIRVSRTDDGTLRFSNVD